MKTLLTYLISTVIFFAIDMVWLALIARNFYKEKIGFLLADKVNWAAAMVFYLLYIGGISYFAVMPAVKENNWQIALINGAILGLLCYATYDLTNLATINKWPLIVVIADIAWGIILTGSVSLLTYFASAKLL